jgi:hypothetical protein
MNTWKDEDGCLLGCCPGDGHLHTRPRENLKSDLEWCLRIAITGIKLYIERLLKQKQCQISHYWLILVKKISTLLGLNFHSSIQESDNSCLSCIVLPFSDMRRRGWRKLLNEELGNLYSLPNITAIKSRRASRMGSATRVGHVRNADNILIGIFAGT